MPGSGTPLQRPLPGPLAERGKTAAPLRGKPVTVSDNKAYVLNETDLGTTTFILSATGYTATATSYADYALRSPRHVCFPARLNT
jgi:hypothetical protein